MPIWTNCSTKSIGFRRDLYTSVAEEIESDRIEKWLNQEVETPAQSVLDRLCGGDHLSAQDRKRLARYVASLDVRSPLHYSKHTQLMSDHIEGVLNAVMERTIAKISESLEKGEVIQSPPPTPERERHSLAVKLHRGDPEGDVDPSLQVSVVLGRENWLDSIEHVVNDVSQLLEDHDWKILRPYSGWTWYTSDLPVLRLNYFSKDKYDFDGGYGWPGTEMLLPLSPSHLLYTQVAKSHHAIERLPLEQTYLLKRIIAEHAFRWIIADSRTRNAEWFRPRVVNLDQYNEEETSWRRFHKEQANAEIALKRPHKPTVDDRLPDERSP